MAPRLKEKYICRDPRGAPCSSSSTSNVMQVGGLTKIVVNMGVGEAARDSKALEGAIRDLAAITGQKPVTTRAKKSIAQFKLREGQAIGAHVTLRGDRMWEFLDRLPLDGASPYPRLPRTVLQAVRRSRQLHLRSHRAVDVPRDRPGLRSTAVRGMDITVVTIGHHRRRGSRRFSVTSASRSRRTDPWPRHRTDRSRLHRKPKFGVRAYTRCNALRSSALGVPQVRTVPRVPARARPPWRAPRCHQEQLVRTNVAGPG